VASIGFFVWTSCVAGIVPCQAYHAYKTVTYRTAMKNPKALVSKSTQKEAIFQQALPLSKQDAV
jgi:hypothetical protein